jgi:peptidyl-prolyl cis-trans isomerase A (cyclophilin A)
MGKEMTQSAPDRFFVSVQTTKGEFQLESQRMWAPHGADRLYNLVRLGFLNKTAFYRTIHKPSCNADWVVQFGVSGNPNISCIYNDNGNATPAHGAILKDDPVFPMLSNTEGVLAYSAVLDMARGGYATNRTTELFISYANNSRLDALGFAPVAVVRKGYGSVVHKLYAGYGEMADSCDLHGFTPCDAPPTNKLYAEGNAYLEKQFPRLDYILTASVSLPS